MVITSTTNPLVKALRQLGESAKHRQKQMQMLLEGTHLIQEAIAAKYPLTVVCCTESWRDRDAELFNQICQLPTCQVTIVAKHVLAAITTTLHPDGVVAAAPLLPPSSCTISKLGIALEDIQDPGNLGTIVRSAVAVGIEGILLSQNCVDIYNPKILRATAGQWFRAPLKPVEDLTAELRYWRDRGLHLVATVPHAALPFWDYDFSQPTMIVLGSEGRGLSPSTLDLADTIVSIPTDPIVESLNVAMAATLLLYEAKRQNFDRTKNA